MQTITGLDDFPTALAVLPLADGRSALACTHATTPGTSEVAYSAAYLVTPGGAATRVVQSEPAGKDIACAIEIQGTTLWLYVTEATPGGGGATARADRYSAEIGVGQAGGAAGFDARPLIKSIVGAVVRALTPFA